jgi:hypothetical protein
MGPPPNPLFPGPCPNPRISGFGGFSRIPGKPCSGAVQTASQTPPGMGVWEAVWEAVWTASQTGSWEPVWEAVWTASQTGSQEPVWEAVWTASQTGCLATSLDTTPDRVLTQVWVASL